MKKVIFSLIFVLFMSGSLFAYGSGPDYTWAQTFGGDYDDTGYSVLQTTGGDFVLLGTKQLDSYGDDSDLYLLKTDQSGNEIWSQTYGEEWVREEGRCVDQTSDGGYILVGSKETSMYEYDIYLIKTDASGDTVWTKTYGGSGTNEKGYSVQQASDGGYIIAGMYGADVWVIKTDSNGDEDWSHTYGGDFEDCGYSVQQTSDGGYIVGGYIGVEVYYIEPKAYLVKLNADGSTDWTQTIIGTGSGDKCYEVQETSDGGYILGGEISIDGPEMSQFYAVKTDSNGDTLWTNTYGGYNTDCGRSIQQTTDGGYIFAGYTYCYGAGSSDVYLIKTTSTGDTTWTKTYGGTNSDGGYCVRQITDGASTIDYILVGYTDDGTSNDIWLLKIDSEDPLSTIVENEQSDILLQNYPNPFYQTTKIFFSVKNYSINTEITVYNTKGQKVKTLVDEKLSAGDHQIVWDGKDDSGKEVKNGIYFYKIMNGETVDIMKMIMMK